MSKKVLITGGAGFIGHTMAKYFASKGLEVKTFDLFQPPKTVGEHIVGTIMFPDELYKAMKGCDYVVHLAAVLGVARTENQRLKCLNVNTLGTINVLDAAVKAGIKKIVLSSSSEVYGEPAKTPISEDDKTFPKSVYAVSNLAGEEYIKAYHQTHGLDYSIVRFFNVYGPGQVAEFVLPKFIRAAMIGTPPIINGDGKQVRSFCYVDDAVEGVYLALTSKEANGHVFNIGNDRAATSMLDLANKVTASAGKNNLGVEFVKEEHADRKNAREIINRIPDISKARRILGYEPKITLDEGIARTIASGHIPESWTEQA